MVAASCTFSADAESRWLIVVHLYEEEVVEIAPFLSSSDGP